MSIRQGINDINERISELQEEKILLQEACKHRNTHTVDYMWRPGATMKVEMCKDCDTIVSNIAEQYVETTITVTDPTDGVVIIEIEEDDFNG